VTASAAWRLRGVLLIGGIGSDDAPIYVLVAVGIACAITVVGIMLTHVGGPAHAVAGSASYAAPAR
jgi:hypothetical protein